MSNKTNIDKSPSGTWWYFPIKSTFFDDSSVRRLRHKHGDTGIVIFIQLCAESLKDGEAGYIERKRTDMGESFAEELAFNIDRDETLFRDVFKTLMNLQLIIPEVEETLIYIPMVGENNKRLTPSARSNRKTRAQEKREKERTSQSEELDSHSGDNNNNSKQQELELEKNNSNSCSLNNSNDCLLFTNDDCEKALESAHAYGGAADAAPDAALSISALIELSEEINVGLSQKGAETYHKITKGGLELYGKPIEVPAKALRGWAKRNREKHPEWFTSADGGDDPARKDPSETNSGSGTADQIDNTNENSFMAQIKALEPLPQWDPWSTTCKNIEDEDYWKLLEDDSFISDATWKKFEKQAVALNKDKDRYANTHALMKIHKENKSAITLGILFAAYDDENIYQYPDVYEYFAKSLPGIRGVECKDFGAIIGKALGLEYTDYELVLDAVADAVVELSNCPASFHDSKLFTYEFVHGWIAQNIEQIIEKVASGASFPELVQYDSERREKYKNH